MVGTVEDEMEIHLLWRRERTSIIAHLFRDRGSDPRRICLSNAKPTNNTLLSNF